MKGKTLIHGNKPWQDDISTIKHALDSIALIAWVPSVHICSGCKKMHVCVNDECKPMNKGNAYNAGNAGNSATSKQPEINLMAEPNEKKTI